MTDPTTVSALAAQVKALSPADRLRLAATLIERGNYAVARPIVASVSDELTILTLFGPQP